MGFPTEKINGEYMVAVKCKKCGDWWYVNEQKCLKRPESVSCHVCGGDVYPFTQTEYIKN